MKTSEVLERALALIPDEQHWIKFVNSEGDRLCLAAALWRDWDVESHEAFARAATFVVRAAPIRGKYSASLSDFNDHPLTTYADVRRVLQQAIADAQAEEAR